MSSEQPSSARRGWWKLYFFLALAMTVAAIALPFFFDNSATPWWDWLYVPLYVFQIVALFGFVYWRRIALPRLWQLLFIATIAYEAWNIYATATDPELTANMQGLSGVHMFMLPVFGIVYFLQIPLWIGLYLYAFRCQELWR